MQPTTVGKLYCTVRVKRLRYTSANAANIHNDLGWCTEVYPYLQPDPVLLRSLFTLDRARPSQIQRCDNMMDHIINFLIRRIRSLPASTCAASNVGHDLKQLFRCRNV